jgi:hypothetical protein
MRHPAGSLAASQSIAKHARNPQAPKARFGCAAKSILGIAACDERYYTSG